MKIKTFTVKMIVEINRLICTSNNQTHICAMPEKIESVLHSAFYPGTAPFVHGGITGIAAAIFFYIIKAHAFFDGNKRTAVICATSFLKINNLTLKYPLSETRNDLADLAEACAASEIALPEIKKWFSMHKRKFKNT